VKKAMTRTRFNWATISCWFETSSDNL